jgi:Cu+-exporting ATPase
MHREISHAEQAFEQRSNLTLYLLTALLAVIIGADLWPVIASWGPVRDWGLPTWPREVYGYRIALLAAVLGGARTLYGSLEGLFEGKIGADLALAIAVVAAILIGEPLVAAEVVFIGMLGECLEAVTFERTQRAVRKLVEVFPRRCWLLRNGEEVRVLVDEVQVGDRVVVKPGAKVPVDGVVVEGRSAVDLSALTGESLPVDRGPGDEVLAGALNQFGGLTIEAKRVREQTVAGRVIELTARALKDKAPIERTADRLARLFLPAVLGLAAVTFLAAMFYHGATWLLRPAEAVRLGWGEAARLSVYPTLSVLVVACPCALILATPAAIIAALGRLAGTGILIKGGSALERLARVDTFALDKTGTVTEGRLELGDVVGLGGLGADDVLRTAATAEQQSEHVVARLIVQQAAARGLAPEPVEEFLAHPGAGVTARVAGQALVVGTPRLLEEQGIALPAEVAGVLEQLDATGQTALLVARSGVVLGVIGARDRVRPEAKAVVAELRRLGLGAISLLTGDRPAAARVVGEALEIAEVHAGLLPQQKAEYVEAQKRQGQRVAMVGDGINDAPALACADVGLAVSGADVAAEAGDIVFMGDPLRHLPLLVRLSRETVRIIRQNILIFAFGVNAAGIVATAWLWPLLAPAGWYEEGPLAAVIYHQLGSLAVLVNAMRLLWFERAATSPTWQRGKAALESFNAWTERNLDLDEGLHWLSHRWKAVALGLGVLAVLAYALSGLTQIEAGEVAVVRRFGRPLEEDLGPGLYWRWPWPVEEVTRLRPDDVRTIEIGFRSVAGTGALPAAMAWSSPHGGDGLRRFPDEAVMITGDGNLVELQATLRYRVSRPRVYLFEVGEPEAILRSAAEAVLREAVAGRAFHDLLTASRGPFARDVLARLNERCQAHGPDGLGVYLDGLALHDLHPPQDVVPAYHDVTRAMEDRDRQVNQAQADVLYNPRSLAQSGQLWQQSERDGNPTRLSLAEAHALALQAVRQAEAARTEKVTAAEAGRDVFLARVEVRTELDLETEGMLVGEAIAAIRSGQSPATAYADYRRRREQWQRVQAVLTDFRIYWDALGRALSGRDKLVIDADKVPGRRQLLLMDPEQFRVPVPVLTSPDRAPLGRPRSEEEGP